MLEAVFELSSLLKFVLAPKVTKQQKFPEKKSAPNVSLHSHISSFMLQQLWP